MRMMRIMNAIRYIRTKVFDVKQAPFAEIAGVSQPTISRWEEESQPGSQPSREEMARIREEAIKRGLNWNDGWFFQTFPDEQGTAA
jgi:DNA-binding transcriptional regulator YiaG